MERIDQKDITDDVWSEIFLHLPFNSIFKFRCVSKVWFSMLSNPYFINKWYQLNYLSLPWALVRHCASVDLENHSTFRRMFTIAYPDSYSKFICHHETGFSFRFLPLNPGEKLFLIGSSSSLVLCSPSIISKTYYVCDPLTQMWDLLPTPPPREFDFAVCGIVCGEFCSSSLLSKSYKVIRIPVFAAAANEFIVEIFSSDLGEWKIYDVSCPQYVNWDTVYVYGNLFTHNGVFYWFQQRKRKILALSVNENTSHGTSGPQCRMIKMPGEAVDGDIKHLSECLGESEGLISFARFQETEMSLSVWVLDGDWYMLHKDIQLYDWLAKMDYQFFGVGVGNWISQFEVAGFSPVDKNVVILSCVEYAWAYNIKTSVCELLCHPGLSTSAGFQPRLQAFHHFLRVTHGSWMFK